MFVFIRNEITNTFYKFGVLSPLSSSFVFTTNILCKTLLHPRSQVAKRDSYPSPGKANSKGTKHSPGKSPNQTKDASTYPLVNCFNLILKKYQQYWFIQVMLDVGCRGPAVRGITKASRLPIGVPLKESLHSIWLVLLHRLRTIFPSSQRSRWPRGDSFARNHYANPKYDLFWNSMS